MKFDSQSKLNRIKNLLEKNKKGIWLNEIAKKADIKIGSIYYFIFGQMKNGKFYGGYLKDDISFVREGRNLIIRLKP